MIRLTVIVDKGRKHDGEGPPPNPGQTYELTVNPQAIGTVLTPDSWGAHEFLAIPHQAFVTMIWGQSFEVVEKPEWIIEQVETLLGHPRTDAHSMMCRGLVKGDRVELTDGWTDEIAACTADIVGMRRCVVIDHKPKGLDGPYRPFEDVKRKVER